MKAAVKLFSMIAICGLFALAACKQGKEAETAADQTPKRPASPSGTMSLHGSYSQRGEVGSFRDCTTGEQWTVAHEGDIAALEAAYLSSGVPSGSPLVVTVEGGIDYRPRPDGSGREIMLIIARFVRLGPGEACP
jgi:uncharacterized lipoprotein NlpE involved in copper resistance